MRIGCHVSISGGIENAPQRAFGLGCEIMQIFSRSPQGKKSTEIANKIAKKFKLSITTYKLSNVYVHTPYYINLASANNRIRYESVSAIREELQRASLIGAKYVMTHLGSTKDLGEKAGIKKTVEMLRKSLNGYASSAKLILENSAGAGEIIGDNFKELAQIIKGVNNKNIAGICLDTQHSFASGYDWTDFEKTLKRIDKEIGLEKIKLIHSNDSQTECGSRKDRHAHIGEGLIGLNTFKEIMEFAKSNDIDMICETAELGVKKDIKILKKMRENNK